MTTNDNEWQRVTTSGTTSDNEWQRVTTSGATSDKQWQRVNTKSDNEWQQIVMSDSSDTANESGTVHFKEWMIAVLSMTKTDTLLLQGMDGCS